MLKESVAFNTARYDAGFGFIVDIEDVVDENGNSVWDVWLYRSGYNIKLYMFGLPRTQIPTIKDAIAVIEANLLGYCSTYDEKYCCGDDIDRAYLFITEMTEEERRRIAELYEYMGRDIVNILSDTDNNYLRYDTGGTDYFIYESEADECGICIETGEIIDAEKIEEMGW